MYIICFYQYEICRYYNRSSIVRFKENRFRSDKKKKRGVVSIKGFKMVHNSVEVVANINIIEYKTRN